MPGVASELDPFILPELPGYPRGNQAYGGRTQVTTGLVAGENTAVIMLFGDSLSTNTVNTVQAATQAKNHNFNVYNGGTYATVEPLLGCQTNSAIPNSGNFFTNVADTLIGNGAFSRVILVPFGVGGSVFADYAKGGAVNGRFGAAYRRIQAAGLTAAHVYWYCMLGANDYGTSQASATASLASIIATIRAISTDNIFVAKHTIFGLTPNSNAQAAISSVLSAANKVYTGGDMDTLTSSSNYFDDTHYNSTGRVNAAAIASAAISAHL